MERMAKETDECQYEAETYQLTDENNQASVVRKKKSLKFPKRYLITLLLFFGLFNLHALRVNFSIALVDMTSNKTVIINNRTVIQEPEFNWDSKTKGFTLSLFFYGFLIMSPLGGYLATKFGGVNTFGCGIFVTSIFTITTPMNLYFNYYWFAFCRVLEGAAEAISYTSTADIWSRWARPEERSKLMGLAFTGVYVGIAVAFPLCGYLAQRYGWPSIFYVTGTIGLVWFFIWIMLATNDPPSNEISCVSDSIRVPTALDTFSWKRFFTSVPVWALIFTKFSYSWGYSLMVQHFPLYLKDVTNTNIENIGYLSAIPNFVSIFTVPISGYFTDWMINRKIMSATNTHKTIMCTSLLGTAILLILISCTSNFTAIMIGFTFFKMLLSFIFVTVQLVPLYLSTRYSSIVCGFTAFGYNLGSVISPILFGFLVTDHSIQQWDAFFTIVAAVSIGSAIVFAVFSSSEIQPWSVIPVKEDYKVDNVSNDIDDD